MNYKEAMSNVLNVRWKVTECSVEDCWCGIIDPEKNIENSDNEEIYIIGSGCITKEHAEHIVKVHNQSLNG